MTSKILINAVDPEEVRLAIVKDSRLEEFHIENAGGKFFTAVSIKV
jgi:ribonuclease E